jgi:hypothetical protein
MPRNRSSSSARSNGSSPWTRSPPSSRRSALYATAEALGWPDVVRLIERSANAFSDLDARYKFRNTLCNCSTSLTRAPPSATGPVPRPAAMMRDRHDADDIVFRRESVDQRERKIGQHQSTTLGVDGGPTQGASRMSRNPRTTSSMNRRAATGFSCS